MEFCGDDRGVTVQIGAVLLFGILIIALATFQATIVPAENAEIEYKHNLDLQTDMLNLRGGLLETGRTGRTTATTVRLGTSYPTRPFFVNPPPPSGTIQTVGTNDDAVNISISSAAATDPEVNDYWTGSDERNFSTGAVVYYPGNNEYQSAPRTGIDSGTGVVYNSQGTATIPLTGQSLIDGNRINLVLISGNLSRSGSLATAVDTRALSSSENTVQVEGPINVTFATRIDPAKWGNNSTNLLENQNNVKNVTSRSLDDEWDLVTISLKNKTYQLSISKVALGPVESASGTEPAYITAVDGDMVVSENTTRTVRFELRDEFNNPTGGKTVNVSLETELGELQYGGTTGDSVTIPGDDHDGEIAVEYIVGNINGSSTNSTTVTATFNGTGNAEARNATVNVTVVNTDGSGTGDGGSDPGPSGSKAYNDANSNGVYDEKEQTYTKSEIENGFDNTSVNLVIPSDLGTLDLNGNETKANSINLQTGIDNGGKQIKLTAEQDITFAGQTLNGSQAQIKAGEGGPGTLDASGATIGTQNNNIELSSNGDMNLEGATLDAGSGAITASLGKGSATLFVDSAIIRDSDDTLNYDPNGVKVDGSPNEGKVQK